MAQSEAEYRPRLARQKRTLTWLAALLIAMGAVVLFLLHRMPLPLRLFVGLFDIFAGFILLLIIRPKFDV